MNAFSLQILLLKSIGVQEVYLFKKVPDFQLNPKLFYVVLYRKYPEKF